MSSRVTYYMVECDYPHETAEQRAAFDTFYWKHISMLLTIPGFSPRSAFTAIRIAGAFPRALSPDRTEVMTSDAYTSKAGRNSVDPEFRPNMINWDRNLVQRPDGTSEPDLATDMDSSLTLIDRRTTDAPPLPDGFTPLTVVGLDQTIAQRGVTVGSADIGKSHGMGNPPLAADPSREISRRLTDVTPDSKSISSLRCSRAAGLCWRPDRSRRYRPGNRLSSLRPASGEYACGLRGRLARDGPLHLGDMLVAEPDLIFIDRLSDRRVDPEGQKKSGPGKGRGKVSTTCIETVIT